MALTDEQNEKLEELFKEKLQEQFQRGIRVGIMTVSKIVYDKLSDGSAPLMKRIEDVKKFCKIAPGIEKKYNDIASKIEGAVETATAGIDDTGEPVAEEQTQNTDD